MERKSNIRRKRKKVTRGRETEAAIQSSIITAMNRLGILSNRVNGGSTVIDSPYGKRTFRCNSLNGKSDLEIWLEIKSESGYSLGVVVYIEVKSKTGKQSASQVEFERLMNKTSQKYIVVRSVADVINFLCDFRDEVKEEMPGFSLVTGVVKDLKRMKDAI